MNYWNYHWTECFTLMFGVSSLLWRSLDPYSVSIKAASSGGTESLIQMCSESSHNGRSIKMHSICPVTHYIETLTSIFAGLTVAMVIESLNSWKCNIINYNKCYIKNTHNTTYTKLPRIPESVA